MAAAARTPSLITGTVADAAKTFHFSEKMLPSLTNIARNDGVLGEQLSAQLLKEATGRQFVPIQNASGHGADLAYIDHATKTIYHVEIKANAVGQIAGSPDLGLPDRFDRWIRQAAKGKINGQQVSPEAEKLAREIEKFSARGYRTSHNLMQVEIPTTGSTGTPTARMRPWLGINGDS